MQRGVDYVVQPHTLRQNEKESNEGGASIAEMCDTEGSLSFVFLSHFDQDLV